MSRGFAALTALFRLLGLVPLLAPASGAVGADPPPDAQASADPPPERWSAAGRESRAYGEGSASRDAGAG